MFFLVWTQSLKRVFGAALEPYGAVKGKLLSTMDQHVGYSVWAETANMTGGVV